MQSKSSLFTGGWCQRTWPALKVPETWSPSWMYSNFFIYLFLQAVKLKTLLRSIFFHRCSSRLSNLSLSHPPTDGFRDCPWISAIIKVSTLFGSLLNTLQLPATTYSSRLKCISGHSADPLHTRGFNTLNPRVCKGHYTQAAAQTTKWSSDPKLWVQGRPRSPWLRDSCMTGSWPWTLTSVGYSSAC